MYTLENNEIIEEVKYGNNFAYILENQNSFLNTNYKILKSQTNDIFIPCVKMLYNGRIQLFYLTEECRRMSSLSSDITVNTLIKIVIHLFSDIIEVQSNGFLSSENIDISWDKIFVDSNTLKVKLIYLPVSFKLFQSYAEFESKLRSNLIQLTNNLMIASDHRIDKLLLNLSNSSLSLKDLRDRCSELLGAADSRPAKCGQKGKFYQDGDMKLVAVNAPYYFEIKLDRDFMMIGRKADAVDVVIPFTKTIGRQHCKIARKPDGYYITDVGSSNGTYINNVRIKQWQEYQFNRGDVIRLADNDFRVV